MHVIVFLYERLPSWDGSDAVAEPPLSLLAKIPALHSKPLASLPAKEDHPLD